MKNADQCSGTFLIKLNRLTDLFGEFPDGFDLALRASLRTCPNRRAEGPESKPKGGLFTKTLFLRE